MKLSRLLFALIPATLVVFLAHPLFAACSTPSGNAGDQIYNSSYNQMQFCNGTAWVNMGSSGTVSGIGTLTNGDWCNTDGSVINCTTSAISLGTSVTGTLQAAQEPAHTGDVTNSAGSLALSIAAGHVTNAMLAGSIDLTTKVTGALPAANFPALTGNVTTSAGSLATTIASGAVTNAMLAGSIDLTSKVTGTLPVGNGGMGAATFTANGVLYGNSTSAIQVTAQGPANSVLTANAGPPSFSASPTIGTSVTSPLHIGGTAAGSTLTLESTSGPGSSDAIIFKTGSQTEAMRINTSGQVGIGTNNPSYPLAVFGSASGTGNLLLKNTSGTGISGFNMVDSSGTSQGNFGYDNSATKIVLNMINHALALQYGGADKVTMDTSGNVGIGTNSPLSLLHISKDVTYSNGTEAQLYVTGNTNTNLRMEIGMDTTSEFGFIQTTKVGTAFKTLLLNPGGGNVGIGTTSPGEALHLYSTSSTYMRVEAPSGSLNSGVSYYHAGARKFITYNQGSNDYFYVVDNSGTGVFLQPSTTSWAATSDVRLKTNIQTLNVLDRLKDYRAVSFDWKGSGKHDVGVIAQELYKIFPEVVKRGSDSGTVTKNTDPGAWGVTYDKLGALALEGVKELKAEIDELKSENAELRREIHAH